MESHKEFIQALWLLFEQLKPDLVRVIVTGLVFAPAAGAMVEYFRKRTADKKRGPLLEMIEKSAIWVEDCAVHLRIAQVALQELGFKVRASVNDAKSPPQPDPAKAMRENFSCLHQMTYDLAWISYQVNRGSAETEKYLNSVTPHLQIEQVSDLVPWVSRIRSIGEAIGYVSRDIREVGERFLRLDETELDKEDLVELVRHVAEVTNDLMTFLDIYNELDDPISHPPQGQWSMMEPRTKLSIRAKAARHFKGQRLKLSFKDGVAAMTPKDPSPLAKLEQVSKWLQSL